MTQATYTPLARDLAEWTKANEDIPQHRRDSLVSSIELIDSMLDLSTIPEAGGLLRLSIETVIAMPKGAIDVIGILVTLLATAEKERKTAHDEFNALSEAQRDAVKGVVGAEAQSR